MKKLSTIGICFCLLISMLAAALFWMPDTWIQRVSYSNPSTASFSFTHKSAVVGDSWSQPKQFNAQIRIGKGCASIEEIKQLVRDFNGTVDTVYIVAGVANSACHGISLEDTMRELPSLIDLCQKQLHPKTIIAYDPRVMWSLLENPQYCYSPREVPISTEDGYMVYDIHINPEGYVQLRGSTPLPLNY